MLISGLAMTGGSLIAGNVFKDISETNKDPKII
jgi:hypothetical protein